MEQVRRFHNHIKQWIIETWLTRKRIIDLGFGYGGDIHKYTKLEVECVFAIEPDLQHIAEAEKRIQVKAATNQNMKHIQIVPCGAEHTNRIMHAFGERKECKLDAAVAFFSLTFAFQSEDKLNRWIETIEKSVRSHGGLFIGTCMDGAATFEFLRDLPCNETFSEGTYYSIKKLYKVDIAEDLFGTAIEIHSEGTIVNHQLEYLVWFDHLIKKLKDIGFQLEITRMFDPPDNTMPPELQRFSRLFRYFVFRRCLRDQ